jgi:hypothetical protein
VAAWLRPLLLIAALVVQRAPPATPSRADGTTAIPGTVVDETGEPVVGVHVRAFRRSFTSAYPSLQKDGYFEPRRTKDAIYRSCRWK